MKKGSILLYKKRMLTFTSITILIFKIIFSIISKIYLSSFSISLCQEYEENKK